MCFLKVQMRLLSKTPLSAWPLILLLLAWCPSAMAYLDTAQRIAGDGQVDHYLYTGSIKPHQGSAVDVVATGVDNYSTERQGTRSVFENAVYHCAQTTRKSYTPLVIVGHAGPMGTGPQTYSQPPAIGRRLSIDAGGPREALFNFVCGQRTGGTPLALNPPAVIAAAPPATPATSVNVSIPVQANRRALVIGNDAYRYVRKLGNARADAVAISSVLRDLGYQVTLEQDVDEKGMRAALRRFRNDVQGGDEVVFFYAGHGMQLGLANYLLPTDIRDESADQVRDDAIELQRFLDSLNERQVKLALAIIDACRDNPFPNANRNLGTRGLAPQQPASGQMIVFSAGAGQVALDNLGPQDRDPNGLFTRIFLKEMRTPGLRVDSIVRDVRKKVVEAARSVGKDQVPAIYDQVVGDFYFIR
jgi:uncharacterized caspase-like protein